MTKVVLIQPPIRDFYLTRKRTLPYGLACLAGALEQKGFPCTLIDGLATSKTRLLPLPDYFAYLEPYFGKEDLSLFSLFSGFRHFGYTIAHLGHLAREEAPFLVGISSLFTPYADQALETARAVKKWVPRAWVVMGGHHATAFPKECLACPDVDFVIQGEGETALPKLCQFLQERKMIAGSDTRERSWERVAGMDTLPGLAYRGQGRIICNPPHWEPNLDQLPLPAMGQIHQAFYSRRRLATITIAASRGCPFGCTYCSVSSRSCHGRFRRRRVSHVLEEIRSQAEKSDIGFIDFEDENLTLDKGWALDLLAGIREIFKRQNARQEGLAGQPLELRAMNGLYPPSLDEELVRAMKATGFKTLNLSVGSFSEEQLNRFGRPDVRKDHARVLALARTLNLDTVSYIIGGAPDQTAAATLDDLLTLAAMTTLGGLSIYYPAPGSADFNLCQDKGLLPDRFELMRSTALPLDQATSRLESVTLLRLSRMINFLKQWADTQGGLPVPQPFSLDQAEAVKTQMTEAGTCGGDLRFSISTRLVQWFLSDGIIRGVDNKGNIYDHRVAPGLCQAFVNRLVKTRIMGVTSGPYHFEH